MRKKTLVLLALSVLSVGIAACGENDQDTNSGTGSATESTNSVQGESEESESQSSQDSQEENVYSIGETWTVDGQWNVTVNSVEETTDRNEYSDKNPAAVYLVTYTYENIGYVDSDGFMDGLYINMDDTIVDAAGKMGYSYPGDQTLYAQETPVGAICEAQACIGVDNAGSFKIHVTTYDRNENKQSAVFSIDL